MKIQSRTQGQWAQLEGSNPGEGLSVFIGQDATKDSQRWQFDVYAKLDTGADMLVGTVFSSPPNSGVPAHPTRQILAAVCPGAITWSVFVRAVGTIFDESINIELASSKCCTAPVGVTRVSQRYGYKAGTGTASVDVLAGQTVTGIAVFGLTGGGTLVLNGGATVTVPAGVGLNLSPEGRIPFGVGVIAVANCDYTIEYLESA